MTGNRPLFPCASSRPASSGGVEDEHGLMFQAMVTRLHSPRALSSPRNEKTELIADLMMPNTGSGVCLRRA